MFATVIVKVPILSIMIAGKVLAIAVRQRLRATVPPSEHAPDQRRRPAELQLPTSFPRSRPRSPAVPKRGSSREKSDTEHPRQPAENSCGFVLLAEEDH